MSVAALTAAVAQDRAAGFEPFLVVGNAGTTSTGSVDPLDAIASFAADNELWLHVDGAYGGFATLTEHGRTLLRGIERADSVTLDPHKWLYQPFECGCLLMRDGSALRRAFHVMPDYLRDTAVADSQNAEVNFAERGIQLTRYARVLKVWISLHYFGLDAFRATIDRSMDLTMHAENIIRANGAFELLTPARLGIVCFRRRYEGSAQDADRANEGLVRKLMESGMGMISSTRVNGVYALRLCILSYRTTINDVEQVLAWLASSEIDGV
jgi:aromatic-L-amino-acid decarboxylase